MNAESMSLVQFDAMPEHPYVQLLLADMEELDVIPLVTARLEQAMHSSLVGLLGGGAHGIRELESPLSD